MELLLVENTYLFMFFVYALGVLLTLIGIVFWNKRYPYNTIPPIVSILSWISFTGFITAIIIRLFDKIIDW